MPHEKYDTCQECDKREASGHPPPLKPSQNVRGMQTAREVMVSVDIADPTKWNYECAICGHRWQS